MIYFLISNLHERAFHFTVNKTYATKKLIRNCLINPSAVSKKCQDKLVITVNKRYTKGVAYIVMCSA